MTADGFVALLSERGLTVRRAKDGYMAQCPSHEDPTPSLHVSEGDDRVLVHCFGGCDTPDVVSSVNRTMADLFHDAPSNGPRPKAPEPEPVALPSDDEQKIAVAALANDRAALDRLAKLRGWDSDVLRRLGVGRGAHGRITFYARGSDGRLVGVTEYDPDPRRRGPKSVSSGVRELFPAPEVVKSGDLWLTEGENDAVTAYTLGMLAVSVPGAAWWAGARGKAAAERLRSRSRIFIVSDCDKPGRDWAQRAGADLAELGVDVRIVDLDPKREDGYDLTDVLADAPDRKLALRLVESRAKGAKAIEAKEDWVAPMGADAFLGLAGRIVRDFDPVTEADKTAILLQFLTAFGNLVGRNAYVLLDGSRHTCALYVLIVGRTAKARKGTAWNRVAEVIEPSARIWHKERIVHGLSSGEGLIWAVRDPVTEYVSPEDGKRLDEDEAGEDAVAKIVDPGVEDKRLFVLAREFSGSLRVMRRDSNTLSSYLRSLWDDGVGGGLTKHSPTRTSNAHVSIAGHITLEELKREMTQLDLDNGFANRFLFSCAKRSKRRPGGGSLDDLTIMGYAQEIAQAVEWATDVGRVTFDVDGWEEYVKAYNGELAVEHAGQWGAVTARGEPIVARLSMIYALLDASALIRARHVRAALAVWRYCDESARFIFARDGAGEPDADKILGALREAPAEGLTRTEIRNVVGGRWENVRIEAALARLADAGLAEKATEATGGRPVERWKAIQR